MHMFIGGNKAVKIKSPKEPRLSTLRPRYLDSFPPTLINFRQPRFASTHPGPFGLKYWAQPLGTRVKYHTI